MPTIRTAALLVALSLVSRPVHGGELTVGDAFRAGAESAWTFEGNGKRIGYHTSRYLGRDDFAGPSAHHFQGAFDLESGIHVRSTADLWVDDHGHPIRFVQQALAGASYSRVELNVDGPRSKARVVQGVSTRDLALDVDRKSYLLANNFLSHLEILLALEPRGADAHEKLFSGSTLQPFDYTLKSKGTFETTIDGAKVTGDAWEDSLGEHLRCANGRLIEIDVPAAKLVIRRTSEKLEPVVIVPPAIKKATDAFDSTDVRITHGSAVIAGTITKKKGASGRLPAAFFVSGSGAQDRNGWSSGIDLGTHEILDRLTSEGLLVLRVDDRGAGESSDLAPDASYDDLVDDARACVDFLAHRDDVDPTRIVLVGHSEGGETVPILAAERGDVRAIVLLAAPGRSIVDVVMDQNELALRKAGVTGDELAKQLTDLRAFFARLVSDVPMEPSTASPEERSTIAARPWFRSHAKHDPLATIRAVKCPVLILQGSKDFQVSPDKDARALEAALADAHHPDHTLKVLDGLDHLFKKSPGATSELADYWSDRPVAPEMLDTLASWVRERIAPK